MFRLAALAFLIADASAISRMRKKVIKLLFGKYNKFQNSKDVAYIA